MSSAQKLYVVFPLSTGTLIAISNLPITPPLLHRSHVIVVKSGKGAAVFFNLSAAAGYFIK
jgi:hypothetical protein